MEFRWRGRGSGEERDRATALRCKIRDSASEGVRRALGSIPSRMREEDYSTSKPGLSVHVPRNDTHSLI